MVNRYFVSYKWSLFDKEVMASVSNRVVTYSKKITDVEDIRAIEDMISRELKENFVKPYIAFSEKDKIKVVVLNWRRMEEEDI
jgi:hypothetical protein